MSWVCCAYSYMQQTCCIRCQIYSQNMEKCPTKSWRWFSSWLPYFHEAWIQTWSSSLHQLRCGCCQIEWYCWSYTILYTNTSQEKNPPLIIVLGFAQGAIHRGCQVLEVGIIVKMRLNFKILSPSILIMLVLGEYFWTPPATVPIWWTKSKYRESESVLNSGQKG